MRYPDGTLIGDANDNLQAISSASLSALNTSSLDENLTTYDLLPVIVNRPPTVTSTMVDGSTPPIKPIDLADASGGNLYTNSNGVVRVCLGTSLTLRFAAQQPDKFNVENGVPVILPDQQDLTYVWKFNETTLTNFQLERLRSVLEVDQGECVITNIQGVHSGVYQCEVSNDIGSVLSEPVTIEVYNPDADPKLYSNLVINPYGREGIDSWNSNTAEFVVKEMSTGPADQFKVVNNTSVFGYTADMMHPRPYQLDPGVLKDVDLTKNLTRQGTYFSRSAYKFLTRGGSTYVKAYQDIDLTDVVDLIRGGVYGISGLRAVFGCYIGTAMSNYTPTVELTPINNRTNRRQHFFGAPRLSLENWLTAGKPELIDRAYVTIEEFENETRLVSRLLDNAGQSTPQAGVVTLHDPYTKALSQAPSVPYYPGSNRFSTDVYGLDLTSPAEHADRIMYAADALMPNYEDRFTFGQYIEFNRVVLDKLNPRTNKIRIALNFFCEDYRLIDPGYMSEQGSDEVWDFHSWGKPCEKNTFTYSNSITGSILQRLNTSEQLPATEKFLAQPDPRPMITGLVLGLLPVLPDKPELTSFYTNQVLLSNTVPVSEVPSQLLPTTFDPFQRRLRKLHTTFHHISNYTSESLDVTALGLIVELPAGGGYRFPITSEQLFPFIPELPVDFHIGGSVEDNAALRRWRVVASRRGDPISAGDWGSFIVRTGSLFTGAPWSNYAEATVLTRDRAASNLSSDLYAKTTGGPFGELNFDVNGQQSQPNQWSGKVRYILHYVVRERGIDNADSNFVLSVHSTPNPGPLYEDQIISADEQLTYNSYLLEIKFPDNTRDRSTQVTISRTDDMIGSGSLDPIAVEHGVSSEGYFYFKLPDEVLYSTPAQGGLGLAVSYSDIPTSLGSSRDVNKATSLYAVQAAGYGSVSGVGFGGTPMLGYDSAGNYYQVDIQAIQDNIMHESTSSFNLGVL